MLTTRPNLLNKIINNPNITTIIYDICRTWNMFAHGQVCISEDCDGTQAEDGIYVLLKEVIDNSIDEFKMQAGKRIEVDIEENLRVSVRDYGRGIPQGKLVEAVSMLNTGGKYDSKRFKKRGTEWCGPQGC